MEFHAVRAAAGGYAHTHIAAKMKNKGTSASGHRRTCKSPGRGINRDWAGAGFLLFFFNSPDKKIDPSWTESGWKNVNVWIIHLCDALTDFRYSILVELRCSLCRSLIASSLWTIYLHSVHNNYSSSSLPFAFFKFNWRKDVPCQSRI